MCPRGRRARRGAGGACWRRFPHAAAALGCAPDKLDYWEDFYANQVFRPGLEALRAYLAK